MPVPEKSKEMLEVERILSTAPLDAAGNRSIPQALYDELYRNWSESKQAWREAALRETEPQQASTSRSQPPPERDAYRASRPEPPPRFSGDGARLARYIEELQVWTDLYGSHFQADERRMIVFLTQGLTDTAAVWKSSKCRESGYGVGIDGRLDTGPFPFQTVNQYLRELGTAFPSINPDLLERRRLRNLVEAQKARGRNRDHILPYCEQFRYLQLEIPSVPEADQKAAFIDGLTLLDGEYVVALAREQHLEGSLAGLLLTVERSESLRLLHSKGGRPTAAPSRSDPMDLDCMSREQLVTELNALRFQPGNGGGRGQQNRGSSQPKGRGQGSSKGKNKSGQRPASRFSEAQKALLSERRRTNACFNCGEKGHTASECEVKDGLYSQATQLE
jgi:hypothetical protein